MKDINSLSDYVIIANIFQSQKISVSIAFKGENTLENLYVVNKFPYDKDDLHIFKKLFSVFSSPQKPNDFLAFFVQNKNFYAIFKYVETTNITTRYDKELSTSPFEERCEILEMILMKIEGLKKLPIEFLGCSTEPQNICVDEEKNIHINYNLKNITTYRGTTTNVIFENIRNIILALLPSECSAGFNKQLHIVLDKCSRGVYNSIPEMIIELKKAEKISKASSWLSYFRYRLSLKKALITKLSRVALTVSIIFGILYLGYSKIMEGQAPSAIQTAISIGKMTYTGGNDESDKTISTENQDNQKGSSEASNIILSEGLDMAYEDYIVQHGDTVSSICDEYYKDPRYVSAVATFNGIESSEKLTAGTILKLPNRTAIALYISK